MTMKRIIILCVVLFATAANASAQSWLDALKGAATELVDEVTGGKATEALLPGKWSYAAPAVRLVSDDLIASTLSSSVTAPIEQKLQKAYDYAGIKAGSCTFTFNADGSFTAVLGKKTLAGTYVYASDTHAIELKFTGLVGSSGIVDEEVLDKLKLTVRSLIASQEECKDLLNLCVEVLYHDNMKALGLGALMVLYGEWMEGREQVQAEE